MARQTQNRILCSSVIRSFLLASALVTFAAPAGADSLDSASVTTHQTHRSFADSCLQELSLHVLSGFTPNRTSPLVIVSDSVGDPEGIAAAAIAHSLSNRGLLIREDTAAHSDDGNWRLLYTVSPIELTLTEPQRREFLGKIWVKRTLHAEIDMTVQDMALGDVLWAGAADSTYSDWVPKNALKSLESSGLAPKVPATGWEKAKLPIIVGGSALLAGVLMLALN